jgi:hypothetical protein
MHTLPFVEITHVAERDGKLTELGAVRSGHPLWRVPAAVVVSMYRAGVRFFVIVHGKVVEVFVDDNTADGNPALRTVEDRTFAHKLDALPRFADAA